MTVFDYENEIEGALDSVTASEFEPLELVIVDDSSRDGSRDRVRSWVESHPDVAARLVVHPANRGLPSARNTALAHARGELVFILDADNRVLPHALGRLAEALDSDPGAALAYGLAARVDDAGRALGLMNLHPWEPERLRVTNYIDAMAMIRADVLRRLGGYATELTPLRLGGLRPLVPDGGGRDARRLRAGDPRHLSIVVFGDGVVGLEHLDHRRLSGCNPTRSQAHGRGAPATLMSTGVPLGLDSRRMHNDSTASESRTVALERRIAELEQRLTGADRQLAEARQRLDRLAAEQAGALRELQLAERRRGSLAYRLAAELRARVGRSR